MIQSTKYPLCSTSSKRHTFTQISVNVIPAARQRNLPDRCVRHNTFDSFKWCHFRTLGIEHRIFNVCETFGSIWKMLVSHLGLRILHSMIQNAANTFIPSLDVSLCKTILRLTVRRTKTKIKCWFGSSKFCKTCSLKFSICHNMRQSVSFAPNKISIQQRPLV